MSNKLAVCLLAGAFAFFAPQLRAQEQPLDPNSSIKFNLPQDSPVTLLSWDMNESHATVRGGAVTLDLHLDVSLRNAATRRVRGVAMLVVAQESSAFGRASVTRLVDVGPGESFPLRVDVRLVRPYPSIGPLIQVNLDGVLFDDLNFYGPNHLNSKRAMTFWEIEARRDRAFFKQVLAAKGPDGLRQVAIDSMRRQDEVRRLDVRLSRGRVTTAASAPGRIAQFAFLDIPNSPVKATTGSAEISGSEVRSPDIEVVNQSGKPVRYVEIEWLVKDRQGRQYLAGAVPTSDADLYLASGKTSRLLQDTSLRFSMQSSSAPLAIDQLMGVVSEVEFSDGNVWVPKREALEAAHALDALSPSPEEQRLIDIYRKRGLPALVRELSKF